MQDGEARPDGAGNRAHDRAMALGDLARAFIVAGYTEPSEPESTSAEADVRIGALLLGQYDNEERLHFAGVCAAGITGALRRTLERYFPALICDESPLAETVTTRVQTHWVEPALVVDVAFQAWMPEWRLWRPTLLDILAGANPSEVRRGLCPRVVRSRRVAGGERQDARRKEYAAEPVLICTRGSARGSASRTPCREGRWIG